MSKKLVMSIPHCSTCEHCLFESQSVTADEVTRAVVEGRPISEPDVSVLCVNKKLCGPGDASFAAMQRRQQDRSQDFMTTCGPFGHFHRLASDAELEERGTLHLKNGLIAKLKFVD